MKKEEKRISKLIGQLFEGPIDIIGDVHGEIDALNNLLSFLEYDDQGNHPEGRRLVFLGDLIDRGPDSPAVVELVKNLVEAGRAQCVLGNHELNLLRGERKDGNGWFTAPEEVGKYPSAPVSGTQKLEFEKFLHTLPLALANDELRVVHACWHHGSVAKLEELKGSLGSLAAFNRFDIEPEPVSPPQGMTEEELDKVLKDHGTPPELMLEQARRDADHQMSNPVRVLTSGVEVVAVKPFWAGGKWRMVARQKWWESYGDEVPVVVGHYWRRFSELPFVLNEKDGPDLFEGIKPHYWMGKTENIYCVDFSVGLRHKANAENPPETLGRLAALRWPEKRVMYDDGQWSVLTP